MKAQQLLSFENSDLAQLIVLRQSFDAAWKHVAPGVQETPAGIEAARLELANSVLKLSRNGITADPEELAAEVLQLMLEEPAQP